MSRPRIVFGAVWKMRRESDRFFCALTSSRFSSDSYSLPFNRQQLADYLSVDRSALSKEMGKMRDEGILNFSKNHFELKRTS